MSTAELQFPRCTRTSAPHERRSDRDRKRTSARRAPARTRRHRRAAAAVRVPDRAGAVAGRCTRRACARFSALLERRFFSLGSGRLRRVGQPPDRRPHLARIRRCDRAAASACRTSADTRTWSRCAACSTSVTAPSIPTSRSKSSPRWSTSMKPGRTQVRVLSLPQPHRRHRRPRRAGNPPAVRPLGGVPARRQFLPRPPAARRRAPRDPDRLAHQRRRKTAQDPARQAVAAVQEAVRRARPQARRRPRPAMPRIATEDDAKPQTSAQRLSLRHARIYSRLGR